MTTWIPVSELEEGVVVLGLRESAPTDPSQRDERSYVVGRKYDQRFVEKTAILNPWTGRWAVCTHFARIP